MICCSRTYSHPQKKEGSFSGREDLVIRMSSLEWTHWCPAVQMGPYDRDTLSFRDNCSQWGSSRRSKESCPYTSYNLLLFVDQNNIKKIILRKGTLAVVDFKLSIKQKRDRGILIFPPKKLDVIFKCSKKGRKNSYSQPQSSLKGQIWKRNPVNCCSQRNFIYLNEKGRKEQIYVWCIQMRPNRWS